MARHIVTTVCVVCLLCANSLHCQEHLQEVNRLQPTNMELSQLMSSNEGQHHPLHGDDREATNSVSIDSRNNNISKLMAGQQLSTSLPLLLLSTSNGGNNATTMLLNTNASAVETQPKKCKNHDESLLSRQRQKRHATHGDASQHALARRPQVTEIFLEFLIKKYGSTDGSTMSTSGFRKMLLQLGLHKFLETRSHNDVNNETCIPDSVLIHHIQPHDLSHHEKHSHEHSHEHDGSDHHDHHDYIDSYRLNEQDLMNVCPILLHEVASAVELERLGCIESSMLHSIDDIEEELYATKSNNIFHVWLYSFISVSICGILGLVGVAIIPFMDTRYYKHIIQFLVSLAVGTMMGDALLHLLPHSLSDQTEMGMIYKGLACMSGIIFFYVTEHGLTMISEWRKSIAKKEAKNPSHAKVVRDPDSSINNSIAGDKLCKSKYSSYPYCYDEIAMDTKNDVWMHLPPNTGGNDATETNANHKVNATATDKRCNGKDNCTINCNDSSNETAQSLLSTSENNYAPISEMNHLHNNYNHALKLDDDGNILSSTLDNHSTGDGISAGNESDTGNKEKSLVSNDTVTVILREHEASHHGHSHKHGHVHSPPDSLSAVAWMIIMGDGLHNFTDGMAIGAAFAENRAGGISTSLAVFCHELPHELGDFAILIKAGMSVRSAVYYNLLSGLLSFVGMACGIIFGQSPEAAQWMFAVAAGLFIYIALVDMMPEISAAHKSLGEFFLQVFGMVVGASTMLSIAIYEGDIMNLFGSTTSSTTAASIGHHNHHLH